MANASDLSCKIIRSSLDSSSKCVVEKISITSWNKTETTVNGHSGNYYQQFNVRTLWIESTQKSALDFWPKGIEKVFPELEVIAIINSNLSSIIQSDLKDFSKLKEIYLSKNLIDSVDSNLFEFNPELRIIDFNDNKLKFVGQDILKPLKKLEKVSFRRNVCFSRGSETLAELKELKAEMNLKCSSPTMRVSPPSTTNAVCDLVKAKLKNTTTELSLTKFKYASCDGNLAFITKQYESCSKPVPLNILKNITCRMYGKEVCYAHDLKVHEENLILKQVLDIARNTINGNQVREIRIEEQQTLYLPTKLSDLFPRLSYFLVTYSGLFKIDSKVFSNLNELTVLIMTHNKIREIPSNSFIDLKNLQILDLSFNKLEILTTDSFRGPSNLQTLKLNDNSLTTIRHEAFEELKDLKTLFLQNNKLKYVNLNVETGFNRIESLDFTNNACIDTNYPKETLKEIKKKLENCVAKVSLSCNFGYEQLNYGGSSNLTGNSCKTKNVNVTHPDTEVMVSESKTPTTIFSVVDQNMIFFPSNLGHSFPALQVIHIENSHLSTIEKSDLAGLSMLSTIIIMKNNLTIVDVDAFDHARNLTHLDLSYNNIQSLPPKLFNGLIHLQTLILSHNFIGEFTIDSLPHANSLVNFQAAYNKLNVIECVVLRNLRKATTIDLAENVCVNTKYQQGGAVSFAELFTEVGINCSPEAALDKK